MNETIDLILGTFLPLIIDFINREVENSKVRFVISLIIPLAVGAVTNLPQLAGGDVSSVLSSAILIFTSAQTVYNLYWKQSDVRKALSLDGGRE